jgi:dTDP-glucose 4,6-dehydratase
MKPSIVQADLEHILERTDGLWQELRGRRLFITGGTGFFGCWLLESFAAANDRFNLDAQAVVLTRHPEAFRAKAPHLAGHPAIRLHAGDVRTFEFPAGDFSHIIHAATESGTNLNSEQPLEMLDTIVEGTRRTLDFAVHCGKPKFLLTSSGAVYGKQPLEMTHIPEEYLGAPNPQDITSAYGEGKRMAELLCSLYYYRHGIDTKIARCFAFVGPGLPLNAHFAIGNFIRDALAGDPIRVNGDGTPYRSYLYAADLAVWLWTILFRAPACRPYNVGAAEERTILAVAQAVAATVPPSSVIVALPPGKSPPQRYVPDVRRAAQELGLQAIIPLNEAILRTLQNAKIR